MLLKPWIKPNTIIISDPIVMQTSKRGYYHWLAGLLLSLLMTLWFYGLYSEIPTQKETQIAFSLMIGLDVWLGFRIIELRINQLSVNYVGLNYRSLFIEETFGWEDIKSIEWWYAPRERVNFYRIKINNNQALAIFADDKWVNLNNGIGYAIAWKRIEPIAITPQISEFIQTVISILMPLAIAIFSFAENEVWRIIGFVLARFFWSLLIWQHSRLELRKTQFYMVLLSLAIIFSLMLVSGAGFQSTFIWWLYSPLLEVIISGIVVELYKLWMKRKKELQAQ